MTQDAVWWKIAMHLDDAQRTLGTVVVRNLQEATLVQTFQERLREGQAHLLEIFHFVGLLPVSVPGETSANPGAPAASVIDTPASPVEALKTGVAPGEVPTRDSAAAPNAEEVDVDAAKGDSPPVLEIGNADLPSARIFRVPSSSKKPAKRKDRDKRRNPGQKTSSLPITEEGVKNLKAPSSTEPSDAALTTIEENLSDKTGEDHW